MQYLLTQEEIDAINDERYERLCFPSLDEYIGGLRHIACNMVVLPEDGVPKSEPHGCVHVINDPRRPPPRYCDHCPVETICRQVKNFSK